MFPGKEISLLDVSVYHNLIILAGGDKQLYFYAYDDSSLLYVLTMPAMPTALAFVHGFSLLLLATEDLKLHVLHFRVQEQLFTICPVAIIDLTSQGPATPVSTDSELQPSLVQRMTEQQQVMYPPRE